MKRRSSEQQQAQPDAHWPKELACIGSIRFARRSSNFEEAVRFYRDLVGLPLYETFGESYGSNGAIFGLPSWNLTLEIVEAVDEVAVDHHEQLCLYFPDNQAHQAAMARLRTAGVEPSSSTRTGKRRERSPSATRTAGKSCSRPSCTGSTSRRQLGLRHPRVPSS
ncbi:glyoxalase-like domain protein [Mycobacterium kansasii]|uniref:Glyoxalase-like domain protein n=1 Tax=Mycobacterium kansasii TaxID=1768 RepID=A0A1V3WAP0_MYCKA|nr:glyoxalase-like domain protein [Mycobacterium kansasii]